MTVFYVKKNIGLELIQWFCLGATCHMHKKLEKLTVVAKSTGGKMNWEKYKSKEMNLWKVIKLL